MNEENFNNMAVNPVNGSPSSVNNQGSFVEANALATDNSQVATSVQEAQSVEATEVQPNPITTVDDGSTLETNNVVSPTPEEPNNVNQGTMVAPTEVPVMQAAPVALVQTPVDDNTVSSEAQAPVQQVVVNQPVANSTNVMSNQVPVNNVNVTDNTIAPVNTNRIIQPQVLANNQTLSELNNDGAMLSPVAPGANQQQSHVSVKSKIDSKKIIILAVVVIVAMLGFSVFGYNVLTCTGEEEIYNAKVTAEVKAYFWFGKINKMVTTKTLELSNLSKDTREEVIKLYKDREDNNNEHVVITEDKIVVTVTTKPANEKESKIKEVDVIEAYEKYDFVCK